MSQDKGTGTGPLDSSPPSATPPATGGDDKLTGHMLEAWKKTVDVQQHFNQIEMDIRKTAVTVIVAVIGAAGFASDRGMQMVLLGFTINIAFLIIVAGMVALGAFFWMDFFQYHKLLRGAVDHGMSLEKALSARGIPVSLTDTIGKFSPVMIRGRKFRSDDKIKLFYQAIAVVLGLFAFGALCSSSATKAAAPTTAPQAVELVAKAPLQADVRIVGGAPLQPQSSATPLGAVVAPAVPLHAAPSVSGATAPSPRAQTQTGQAAP